MITLYRAPFSTNVERVALALAHKGFEVESVVISYADRSPVIEVSGQPLVPVIVDEGTVIADSTRILRYLEERRPDPPLFPRDPARRAELDVFLDWFNEVWKRAPNEIEEELEKSIAPVRAEPGPSRTAPAPVRARIDLLSARMRAWLDVFESLLDGRDFVFGELSAADCAAFPFLKYGAGLRHPDDDELFHRVLEDHLRLDGTQPRLAAWIERMNRLPRV